MFKLRTGYLISGIVTGLILLFSFITTLPDGKLHIVFCNVGQGDAAYIRFPDGHDMVVDGGPDDQVINCLGKHMPFWDRRIDLVVLSHPQKDHMAGLVSVFDRFKVQYFIHSDVSEKTEGYDKLIAEVKTKKIPEKLVTAGDAITVGNTNLAIVWPSKTEIASIKPASVLGATTDTNVNEACVVLHLSYGRFDALFTGDADSPVDPEIFSRQFADSGELEVLKVPHHGAKTGMTDDFLNWLYPNGRSGKCNSTFNQSSITNNHEPITNNASLCPLAVISVGKNSYGHPAPETISRLKAKGVKVLRTDEAGDVEVISDGKSWNYKTSGIITTAKSSKY